MAGRDANLLPLPVLTVDPERHGGTSLDGSLGVNLQMPGTGARVAFEAGAPLWQDLDGPQLGSEWWTVVGAQFAF